LIKPNGGRESRPANAKTKHRFQKKRSEKTEKENGRGYFEGEPSPSPPVLGMSSGFGILKKGPNTKKKKVKRGEVWCLVQQKEKRLVEKK